LGFHIRHIGGSVNRLMTYARGEQLSVAQFAELEREMESGASLAELLADMDSLLSKAEATARDLDPADFEKPRAIGRSRLTTTLAGLLVHIAEHTQRHVGEAIITAKILRT